jgi:hypothetical protein
LVAAGALAVVVALAVTLALWLGSPSGTGDDHEPAKVLFAGLDGVSCVSPGRCVAVGDYLPVDADAAEGDPDGDGEASHTLVETLEGRHWAHDPSPDLGRGGSELAGVSCPGVGGCVAVGFYRPDPFPATATTAPPSDPLIETETGGRWRIVAGPAAAPDSVLVSVSCPAITDCTAAGDTILGESGGTALESFFVEHFDGRSWTLAAVSPPPGTVAAIDSISCASASACVAVGDVAARSDPTATHPLVEMREQGTWTVPSLPSFGAGQGVLHDVSCPSAGQCVAAGNETTGARTGAALVLSLSASTWHLDEAALGQSGDPSLTALGCTEADHCVVAGTALESAAKVLAQVDDAGWQPLSPPAFSDNVQAIACPSDSTCVVVGNAYVNGFGNTSALTALLSAGVWSAQANPSL